ncbi:hypothetical protein GCM10007242_16700 [Pigmentiphaga litoralis]|uniref:hypothetical protein n=1 Tax=Pigmentiphaga litoralis TaxID=516702 RepID=UPI0016787C62|nr:hypothetical protein [Pigmentiphaga litoralis]GGX11271.1 hypothetical protein GCM10007242_16700 [Pigmentiphaga litoralis]
MTQIAQSTSSLSDWARPRPTLDGKSALTHLFNRLDGSYPGKFRSAFTTSDSIDNWKATWEAAFIREGIQPQEVALALDRMKGEWPPSLPEFLALCRPPVDPEQAFYVAVDGMQARQRGEIGNWPHPAIYWAAVRIGQHDMLASGYSGLKGRWSNALRDVMSKGKWADVPEPVLALAAPGQSPTSDAEARDQLAKLNAAVAGAIKSVPAQVGGRDLRWAHKIIEADRAGKQRPPMVSVQMAERALRAAGEIDCA